jgi:TonB family protein
MKKTMPLTLFLTVLFLPAVFVLAKEDTPSQPLAVNPLAGESRAASFPLEFSVSPGKWSQARTGKIFTAGTQAADFILPSLKEDPAPIRYPRWAVREGWEGRFVIASEVLKSGEVGRWQVIESTGYPLLDETATGAVRRWRFHPATQQGSAIVSCIEVPIHFELTE